VTRHTLENWLNTQSRHSYFWLTLFALPLILLVSSRWFPTPDSNAYLSIARGIAANHALRNFGNPHIAYPPGYPFLISPAFLVSPRPFLIISVIQLLMALLFMIGLYRWTSRQAPTAALLLTGLVMVNVSLWIYYRRTLSEVAFMTVMIWTVIALNHTLNAQNGYLRAVSLLAGTALLVLLAMVREAGALFASGFVLAIGLACHNRTIRWIDGLWIIVVVCLPVAAGLEAFLLYDQAAFRNAPKVFGTHLSGFIGGATPFTHRILEGLRLQISATGRLLLPGMFKAYAQGWVNFDLLLYLCVFVALAAGWWKWLRRRPDIYALTLPFYFVLYAVWAFDADTRYLLPMLPAILVSIWYLIEPYRSWRMTALAAMLVLHLAVAAGYTALVELPRERQCNQQWTAIDVFAARLKADSGGVIAGAGVPECSRLMLSFLLDRPVADQRTNPSALAGARWLLAPVKPPPFDHFEEELTAGGYKLFRRLPSSPTMVR
jgi:hypothetical protein